MAPGVAHPASLAKSCKSCQVFLPAPVMLAGGAEPSPPPLRHVQYAHLMTISKSIPPAQ